MSKYKVLALMGESGSGKDTLKNTLCTQYPDTFRRVVTCTTRPARNKEKNGVDYFFLTPDEFAKKILDMSMLEAQCFNGWYYGTPIDSFKEGIINVVILTPDGVRNVQETKDINLLTVYLKVPAKKRIIRALKREDNPDIDEIYRRYKADLKDFASLDDIDYRTIDNDDILLFTLSKLKSILRSKEWSINEQFTWL